MPEEQQNLEEVMTNQFIVHDFKLPNHKVELNNANCVLEKHKQVFKKVREDNNIDDKIHLYLYEETVRVLDYVGRLSMRAFEIQNELEELYTMEYRHAPELAKQLYFNHYESIHHPYNTMKNRCFHLLDELDEVYIKTNKKFPSNWNI